MEGGTGRRWNQEGFRVSGDAGFEVLRLLFAVGIDGVAIEDRGDAVAVEAVTRARDRRLCGPQSGDEQKQAGEMACTQRHGCL